MMDGKVSFVVEQMKAAYYAFVTYHEQLTKFGSGNLAEASTQLTTVRRGKYWVGRTAAFHHGGRNIYVSIESVTTTPGVDDDTLFATEDFS